MISAADGRSIRCLVADVRAAIHDSLLERDDELAQITLALDDAAAGRGQLVVVEAAAGLGKTSLLEAAQASARACGFEALSARGSELERGFPFGIVRQLLEPRVAAMHGDERDLLFAGAARLARPLFEAEPARETADAAYPMLHGLYWLISNLADRGPLVLSVDDLHWGDAPSLRFFTFLLARLEEMPLALLMGMRPVESDANVLLSHLTVEAKSISIRPRPLSRHATADLVECHLGQRPDPEFADACHAATVGNPFFIQTLLREVASQGIEPTADQAARIRALGPRAVSRAVVMRLAMVPGGASLARAVAVLGDGTALVHAAPLAEMQERAAAQAADALVRGAILKHGSRLEFVHPIVRQAVYADLAPHERAEHHARAARLLAGSGEHPERVAAQLLQAAPAGDAWVADTLTRAAQDALSRGAPDSAAQYLRRGLAERPVADARLLQLLGAAEAQLGHPDAPMHLEQAMQADSDARTRALAAHDLALLHGLGGDVPRAVELFTEAIDLVCADDRELALEFEAELAAVGMFDSACARRVRPRVERLLDEVSGRTTAERAVLGQIALNHAMACAPAADVAALAQRALATPRWLVGRHPEAPQYYHAVAVLVSTERYDLAAEHLEHALKAGRTAGSPMTVAVAEYHRSRLAYHRGALREAEADAEHSLGLMHRHPWGAARAGSLVTLIEALVDRGALDAADHLIKEHALEGDIPDGLTYNLLVQARGRLRLAQDRPAEALDDLLEYGRREHDWFGANPALSSYRSATARALKALGESGRAQALAEEELSLARAFGAQRAIGIALCTCGVIQAQRGIGLLEEAVAVLERSGAQADLARALVEHGIWLRRANRRADAREPLNRGHELARSIGADGLAQQAEAELQAAGAKPRRQPATGLDALTASERRIAAMAAEGASNPQIAQALFVSLKTVETHLRNAYRKLDVHSRNELPRVLAGSPSA